MKNRFQSFCGVRKPQPHYPLTSWAFFVSRFWMWRGRMADTMKRKLKWNAAMLGVLVVGFGVALFLWPRDKITVDSWKQIRIGMTEKEVEEILGGPGMSRDKYNAHREWIDPDFSLLKVIALSEPKSRNWLIESEIEVLGENTGILARPTGLHAN
jgi:hypothetical protein